MCIVLKLTKYFFSSTAMLRFVVEFLILDLGFFEANKIYSRRWPQEVIFKESKGLLGLGKCQSANFAAQIASTYLVALQYNIPAKN